KTAIHFYGTKITYAEVNRSADALAGFLQKRCGVRRGDRVLMYLQNSPQFVIAYYAILRADAVVVPVNPMNRTEELRHYMEDADASAVIAGQELFAELAPLRSLRHVLLASYADYLREPTDLPVPAFVCAPRPAWSCGRAGTAAARRWRSSVAGSRTGRGSPPCWSISCRTRSSSAVTCRRSASSAAAARRCPKPWRAGSRK